MSLESLRAKIIEANPSIVDLVFGCKYTLNGQGGTYTVDDSNYVVDKERKIVKIISICNHPKNTKCCGTYQNIDDEPVTYSIKEIIGRPIRWADILLALEHFNVRPEISTYGTKAMISHYDSSNYETHAYYDLTKDSLADQDESFISFLSDLLLTK